MWWTSMCLSWRIRHLDKVYRQTLIEIYHDEYSVKTVQSPNTHLQSHLTFSIHSTYVAISGILIKMHISQSRRIDVRNGGDFRWYIFIGWFCNCDIKFGVFKVVLLPHLRCGMCWYLFGFATTTSCLIREGIEVCNVPCCSWDSMLFCRLVYSVALPKPGLLSSSEPYPVCRWSYRRR